MAKKKLLNQETELTGRQTQKAYDKYGHENYQEPVIEKPSDKFSIKELISKPSEEDINKMSFEDQMKYDSADWWNGSPTKDEYAKLLKHPKWQRKRLEIMQRDGFKCCLCGDEETTLNIHHKEYVNGKKPWEYENEMLITVCEDCHAVIELFKKSDRDVLCSKVLKIKNVKNYSQIYHFVELEEDQNRPGFMIVEKNEKNEMIHHASFGNYFGSFDRIMDFILKIKNNV